MNVSYQFSSICNLNHKTDVKKSKQFLKCHKIPKVLLKKTYLICYNI